MPDELLGRVQQAASERGMTTSDLIRAALEAFLDAEPDDPTDFDVVAALSRRARAGNVAACRELLRHLRWQADRTPRSPEPDNPFDVFDDELMNTNDRKDPHA